VYNCTEEREQNSFLHAKRLQMLKQDEISRIERYLDGTASRQDIAWVEDLFSAGQTNENLKLHLQSDWEKEEPENVAVDANLDMMLDRVHHLIRKKESAQKKSLLRQITGVYSKVAAILLLPLVISGALYFLNDNRSINPVSDQQVKSVIYAPMGARVAFNLPDGTTGFLNSGSKLSYALPFSNNRKISLEGEAWFDVVHNEKQPFEISAGESKIKVLGTSFNVSAYSEERYVEVVLQNGKVEFSDNVRAGQVVMKPSERLVFRDKKVFVDAVDPSKYKGWTDGKLIFRGDNMAEVARRIERWYDVKVEIADKNLDQFSFRATFKDDSLLEVLKLLSMTSPIDFKIVPRTQLPDGTYEKEKVILKHKN
jgi:ferric-dicitrate binding protein FerR (iron transport regulator)